MKMDRDEVVERLIEEDRMIYLFSRKIRSLLEDEAIQRAIISIVNRCEICELNVKFIKKDFAGFDLRGYEENLRTLEEEWFSKGYIIDWKSMHQDDVITFTLD